MKYKDKCPVCGNEEFEYIRTNSSPYIHPKGSVEIVCCTNCGVLKVSEYSMNFRKIKK